MSVTLPMNSSAGIPTVLRVLFVVYLLASLVHFAHNAEYLSYYPNMPAWITRETVYLVWLAQAAVGAAAWVLAAARWRVLALVLLAAYGAFGLDGLGHYTLALCSEHSLAMNLTIWAEVVTGLLLMLSAAVHIPVVQSQRMLVVGGG